MSRPSIIFATVFLTSHRLGSQRGGVQSSLAKLQKLDLVEQDELGWRVTDPIFCKWLAQQAAMSYHSVAFGLIVVEVLWAAGCETN